MNNKQTVKKDQAQDKPVAQPKTKVPGIETQLLGKRLSFRSLDWSKAIVGKLVKVEKYVYVVETDKGTIVLMKHAVSSISGAANQEDS